jgi:hypothetical protein
MENGWNSKRTADGATAETRGTKKNGGHVKRMIVLNRLRQDAEGFARIVTMNSCSISPEAI